MRNKFACLVAMLLLTVLFFACDNYNYEDEEAAMMNMEDEGYIEEEVPFDPPPTQEELIKEHKVKTKRTDYEEDDTYSIEEYDKRGLLVKRKYFNGKKTETSAYTYELDSLGRVLESVEVTDDNEYKTSYNYDDKGRINTKIFTVKGEEPHRTTYLYYDNDYSMDEMDEYGEYITFYDHRWLEEKKVSYDTEGKIDAVIEYTNDEKGNRITESSSVMGISVVDKMTYNERGQLLRKERGGMVQVIMTYEYDDKGLCTKFIREKGTAPTTAVYTYEYY